MDFLRFLDFMVWVTKLIILVNLALAYILSAIRLRYTVVNFNGNILFEGNMLNLYKCINAVCCFLLISSCSSQVKTPKNMSFGDAEFVESVITHVLYHELGHAVFREFKIPVLANEENMADAFATAYIVKYDRENAIDIVTRRALSWMLEDSEVEPANYDLMGEHELDIRRAYRTLCQTYGADPAEWENYFTWVGFSENDLNGCSETSPAVEEEWQRIFSGIRSDSKLHKDLINVRYGNSHLNDYVKELGMLERLAEEASKFNWPNSIEIYFSVCDGGAYWSKQYRIITLCDRYVERFIEQGKKINKFTK